LRYSAEFNAFRIAGGVGYSEEDDINGVATEIVQGSASLMHTPTGLFAAFSAGESTADGDDDSRYWYVTGGIERTLLSYGKTTIYGEYGQYEDDAADAEDDTLYGFGLTQSFDAAALDIYAQYRYVEEDRPDGDSFATGLLGAKISF
jgi:hypothetical protein